MIEHLQGRQKALEPLGWTGRKAEWIALACLHGEGVFSRAQLAFYLQISRWQALRFVRSLVTKGFAAEDTLENQKVCRIFRRRVYQALGTEDIRHRPVSSREILLRRLLSLDYVLEHPGLPWLPTESEKVAAFKALGIERRHLPLRVYRGAVGRPGTTSGSSCRSQWNLTGLSSSTPIPDTEPPRRCAPGARVIDGSESSEGAGPEGRSSGVAGRSRP